MTFFDDLLKKVPKGALQRSWKRLVVRYRRARSEAAFVLVVGSLLLMTSLAGFRCWFEAAASYQQIVRRDFIAAVGQELEPRDNIYRPATIAPLVASIQGIGNRAVICASHVEAACNLASFLTENVLTLFALASNECLVWSGSAPQVLPGAPSLGESEKCAPGQGNRASEELHALWMRSGLAGGEAEWITSTRLAVESAHRSLYKKPFDLETAGKCSTEDKTIASDAALCTTSRTLLVGSTQTIVPAYANLEHLPQGAPDPNGGEVERALRISVAVANLLDSAANLIDPGRISRKSSTSDTRQLVQAYIVSKESVLRIWTPDFASPASLLPPERLWAQANYFQPAWKQDQKKSWFTRPYLDLGGHGIVETECAPLRHQIDGLPLYVGIICTDLALNTSALGAVFSKLSTYQYLDTGKLVLSHSPGEDLKAIFYRAGHPASDRKLDNVSKWVVEQLKSVNDQTLNSSLMRDIRALDHEGDRVFVIPVHGPLENAPEIWLLRLNISEGPTAMFALAIASALLFALWLAACYFGYRGSRETSATTKEVGLFRSAQFGVLVTDAEDRIVCGNDRAEEILGMELPKVITAAPTDKKFLTDVANRFAVAQSLFLSRDRSHGDWNTMPAENLLAYLLGPSRDRSLYEEIRPAQISSMRQQGGVSRYYAELLLHGGRKTWVVVKASPILSIRGRAFGADQLATTTFGVIEPVQSIQAVLIERSLARLGDG